jgi:excisionase family DNA binding protein
MEGRGEQQRIVELELQQAQYEASLAERRYAACDPDNRLIAAQLEKSWEAALRRVEACQARLEAVQKPDPAVASPDFAGLADDLDAAWNAPGVTMRTRQRLLRALVTDIIADVDETAREVVLTIHWRGGQHSQLRVRKPKSGEHGCRTPEEALAVMRSMATRWSDEDIAASLNRMGMPTGQGKTWTAHRVSSLRRVHGIHAYRSAEKNGEWLTMTEAAARLGVTHHRIRRLINDGILEAEQVVPGAPYQIRASDLQHEQVTAAIARTGRPCRVVPENQLPMFSDA